MTFNETHAAELRDNANKTWNYKYVGEEPLPKYLSMIAGVLKEGDTLVDVGCGTGHIVQELGSILDELSIKVIGIDISPDMIRIACENNDDHPDYKWLVGDEKQLPLTDGSADIVLSRLADYTPSEIARILKKGGHFIEYGLGPLDSKEIAIAFGDRYDCEYYPDDPEGWFKNRESELTSAGLLTEHFEIIEGTDYLTRLQLEETIEMVPLARDYPSKGDDKIIDGLENEVNDEGIRLYRISRQATLRSAKKSK